jgi:hypothetical protein
MVVIFDMMVTAWVVVMTKEFGNDDSGYQNRDEGLLEVVFREKMAITRSGNTGQGNSQIVTMTENEVSRDRQVNNREQAFVMTMMLVVMNLIPEISDDHDRGTCTCHLSPAPVIAVFLHPKALPDMSIFARKDPAVLSV